MVDGLRRRRTRSSAQKRAIVSEAMAPGVSVAAVAQRHEVNANLLFEWLRDAGHGRGTAPRAAVTGGPAGFVPLGVVSAAAEAGGPLLELPVTRSAPSRGRTGGLVEIEIAGARIRFDASLDAASLRRVLRVLKELA